MRMGPQYPFLWSGKLWSTLVTSHWCLSHLLSSSLVSLFRILTGFVVSRKEQKSLHNWLMQCDQQQWFCEPGWPHSSSLTMGASLDVWGQGKLITAESVLCWWLCWDFYHFKLTEDTRVDVSKSCLWTVNLSFSVSVIWSSCQWKQIA